MNMPITATIITDTPVTSGGYKNVNGMPITAIIIRPIRVPESRFSPSLSPISRYAPARLQPSITAIMLPMAPPGLSLSRKKSAMPPTVSITAA